MANKSTKEEQTPGTFAQLYDVHEQLSRQNAKSLGRPKKKTQRKPTTIHLTQLENRNLSKLHLLVNDQFSINRSEIVGVAIDVLSFLLEEKGEDYLIAAQLNDAEGFRQHLLEIIKS